MCSNSHEKSLEDEQPIKGMITQKRAMANFMRGLPEIFLMRCNPNQEVTYQQMRNVIGCFRFYCYLFIRMVSIVEPLSVQMSRSQECYFLLKYCPNLLVLIQSNHSLGKKLGFHRTFPQKFHHRNFERYGL